jgi:iron complex transport system ATP-binding protein
VGSRLAIEVRGVRIAYGTADVLHGVTLEVPAGGFLAVVGPNGSGKSTLLRAVARALKPRAGAVLLDGRDVGSWDSREFAREVAVVPQHGEPAFDYTARELVAMGRTPYERRFTPDAGGREAVEGAMRRVGVWELRDRPASTLSGGERQLVRLARALAQQPEVLLLDEPTNHLDIRHQVTFMEVLKGLNRGGVTVLMVVHDLNLAARYADRVIVMREGEISAAGPPSAALNPAVVRAVFGAEVEVSVSPRTGALNVQTVGVPDPGAGGEPRVHLVCGGGSGAALMRRLYEEGIPFSAGVVNAGDTDHALARALGAPVVEGAPYSPVSDEAHAANVAAAERAELVAVCDMPVGPGNLRNLQAALEALDAGVPVVLLRDGPHHGEKRDYTGGAATELARRLKSGGARVVESADGVVRLLAPDRGAGREPAARRTS